MEGSEKTGNAPDDGAIRMTPIAKKFDNAYTSIAGKRLLDPRQDGYHLHHERVVFLTLDMIRKCESKASHEGFIIERKKGIVYIDGVEVSTDDKTRAEWQGFTNWQRFIGEEPGLKIKVLHDDVIIRPFAIECFKRSNLQLPPGALQKVRWDLHALFKEMPLQGMVVAKGDGWITDNGGFRPVNVGIGEHVGMRSAVIVNDFIYRDTLYYSTKLGQIGSVYPREYTDSFEKLDFERPGNK